MSKSKMSLDDLISHRDNLLKTYNETENVRKRNNVGRSIDLYTKKINQAYYHAIANGPSSEFKGSTPKALKEWKDGLCSVKCSVDDRSIGACTCYNIAVQKSLDSGLKLE